MGNWKIDRNGCGDYKDGTSAFSDTSQTPCSVSIPVELLRDLIECARDADAAHWDLEDSRNGIDTWYWKTMLKAQKYMKQNAAAHKRRNNERSKET